VLSRTSPAAVTMKLRSAGRSITIPLSVSMM
jgi:hypothetical protein